MKPILVCLHGWGGSQESFAELRTALAGTDVEVLAMDLPGFGKEPEPKEPWSVDDYADWVETWIKAHVQPLRPFHLIGHSHGGRIGIKLASRGSLPIAHLYLCAAAGIRRGQYLKRAVAWIMAKTGKLLLSLPILANRAQPLARKLFYRLLRVHDYEVANTMMKQTMVRVTAENLRPLLPLIRVPTDLFWGTDDRITPYRDALVAKRELPGSVLHTYPGVRHRVHRDRAAEVASVIKERLAEGHSR